jgi:hypothetical protein
MSKITKYKISATIAAGATAASVYSVPIRGKVLAVGVDYPSHVCTVDLDTDGEASAQKILDLASASTDATYYPRTSSQDNAGADVTFDGTNEIYEPFVVYGRIKLSLASGTATETVTVYLMVEE